LLGLARSDRDPALIVVALMTPNFNGSEFVKRLRATNGHASTPVIVVSGLAIGEWELHVGADSYPPKPFRNRELLGLVEELLQPE
jgi:DNA-binding response OmpR family regulator